jgi:hypothetical protein
MAPLPRDRAYTNVPVTSRKVGGGMYGENWDNEVGFGPI